MVILNVLRLLLAMALAFGAGKLVAKLKLPAILGWLIAGMILGPHALGLLDQSILDAGWYGIAESILECTVGLMIGTELIWKTIKRSGKQADTGFAGIVPGFSAGAAGHRHRLYYRQTVAAYQKQARRAGNYSSHAFGLLWPGPVFKPGGTPISRAQFPADWHGVFHGVRQYD